ncbi:hypothetical protein BOTBODRAFT_469047 [Botryobasidium botryosum FD-172 SS1]|uniref:Uncharacterized protein n=1 Tax=Botryobasidium botryosum (strain FD-172 SS1) TaxID=930990 RepID=A0A067M5Y6_BOTB1|nr:hypothetical protein BOTBODRAFT_469047 [Botryobasidium botryosum FD-172 SS1]
MLCPIGVSLFWAPPDTSPAPIGWPRLPETRWLPSGNKQATRVADNALALSSRLSLLRALFLVKKQQQQFLWLANTISIDGGAADRQTDGAVPPSAPPRQPAHPNPVHSFYVSINPAPSCSL